MANTPASHTPNNLKDQSSIGLLVHLLAENKIAARLEHHDTWPNIDGYMDIQDDNNILIGSFWVQVKTLPDNNLRLSLEEKFWVFCDKVAIQPVIVFGIDKTNQKAYWKHIYNVDYKKHGGKTIHFDTEKYIARQESSDFIDEWKKILSEYKSKFREYDRLKDEYNTLLTYSNPALGKENIDFINIHSFLDEYNKLLDGPFNRIKQIFYPKSWKVGFAYHTYNTNETAYRCYPIPPNFNDMQIKNVDKEYTHTSRSPNPIEKDPIHHAQGEIRFDTFENILHYKYLDHTGNIFFIQEFIISIVDKFKTLTDLETKSEYTIDEISNLKERIKERDQEVRNISFDIKNFTASIFHIFEEMISFLKEQNITIIRRVYGTSIEDNFKILFENLPAAYNQIIKNNFPLLEKELSLFVDGSDTIIITLESIHNEQRYNLIYLKSLEKKKEPSLEVIVNEESKAFFSNPSNWIEDNILYKGDKYKIIEAYTPKATFISKDFPMLWYIYAMLIARFDDYFVKLGFENQRGIYYHAEANPRLFG